MPFPLLAPPPGSGPAPELLWLGTRPFGALAALSPFLVLVACSGRETGNEDPDSRKYETDAGVQLEAGAPRPAEDAASGSSTPEPGAGGASGGGSASLPNAPDAALDEPNTPPPRVPPGSGGAPSNDPEKRLPGDVLFQPGQLLQVELAATADVISAIEERGNEEVYHPASVRIRGAGVDTGELPEVGFRHKGNWSLHHCWDQFGGERSYEAECSKLSYKIKFHEYDPDVRLDGVKRLNLHAVSGEPSKMRDLIAYQTFRSFGVDAPRAVPAQVTVNGELIGLFIAVEAIDGRYTASHYPEGGDGNLYKEIWPNVGAAEEDFVQALRTNDEMPDISDLTAFAQAVESSTTADFDAQMEPWVDVPHLLRYIAVDRAIKNWDGIMGFYLPYTPHNFYWYHDNGAEGRFHLIPWDLDNTFWEFDPYMAPEQWATAAPVPDWNRTPRNCNPRAVWTEDSGVLITPPRCDTFLDRLAVVHWQEFVTAGQELLAGPMAPETTDEQITYWSEVLEPLVSEDPTLSVEEWRSQVEELRRFTRGAASDFQAYLEEGLVAESEPTPPIMPEPPTSLDAPTDNDGLRVFDLTNFEYPAVTGEPAGVFTLNADTSEVSAFWNDVDPLSGSADLRAEFSFTDGPDAYDEWVNIGLTSAPSDVRGARGIWMTLRTDIPRVVRIRLLSDAYDEEWGGIWAEFGSYYEVSDEATTLFFDFSTQTYPDWAKESWESGQGFSGTDAAALELALAAFSGLLFNPEPSWDAEGLLPTTSETGYLQIDNLWFE